jgi:aminomethyltransferase
MSAKAVAQGRLVSPFYSRQRELDTVNRWHDWQGYTVPDELYCSELEYFAIRNSTSVFDLTPMTKYRINGPDALAYMNRLVTRDMTKVAVGRVAYAVWCNDAGQVLDDGTIFRLGENDYRLCAQERHLDWLLASAVGFDVTIRHETDDVAGLAIQGPTAFAVLERMGLGSVAALKPFDVADVAFGNETVTVSRTGFTGDLGYEAWMPPHTAGLFWDLLFDAGSVTGIRAIGTDALEIARIEAGYLTAGIDFVPADIAVRPGRTRSPFELGLDWLVDFTKPVFNGRRALAEAMRNGSRWRLVRLDIEGNKPAGDAYIFARKRGGDSIGFVTSAAWSPVCKQSIALGTVDARYGQPGETLYTEIFYRRELHWQRVMARATVVDGPFWNPARRRATPPSRA